MDRRINKTKTLIKKSIIELMKKEDFRSITVTSLTKYADINRGTFYLHYFDIYDLVEELENEAIDEITKIALKYDCLKIGYYNTLSEIVTYVKANRDFFTVIMGIHGDISFIDKIRNKMKDIFIISSFPQKKPNHDQLFQEAIAIFIISGGIGLFQEWLKSGCKDNINILIRQFELFFKDLKFNNN